MSDELPNFVLGTYSKAVKLNLMEWLVANPLPTVCEPKLDGIRIFLFKSGDKLVISSKHGAIFTPKSSPKVFGYVPEFTHAPHRMILDGEYVSTKGVFLFDVIQIDDRDVRNMVLSERKKILREILQETGLEVLYRLMSTAEEITAFRDDEVRKGGEGIIAKNPMSTYGQANSWLKLKRFDTIDCFIIDYEETPEMRRTGIPRSWYVGVYNDAGQQVNLGKVGAFVEGVDPRQVKKESVVEVRIQEVTNDMKLRGAFILRVRHDKTPEECLISQL